MQINFDASQVQPAAPPEVIPADWYNAMITETSEQDTSDQTGKMLAIKMTVMDGPHQGHVLFDRLNLVNRNQTAVEIAYRTLSAICHAVGVIQVADTQQLHGRPMAVKVGIDPARTDNATGQSYEARNKVQGYKPGNAEQYRKKPTFAPPPQMGAQPPAAPQQWAPPAQPQAFPPAAAPAQPWQQAQQAPQPQAWQAPAQAAPAPWQQSPQPAFQPPAQPAQGTPSSAAPWQNAATPSPAQAQPQTTAPSPAAANAQPNPPWQQAQSAQGGGAPVPPWAQK